MSYIGKAVELTNEQIEIINVFMLGRQGSDLPNDHLTRAKMQELTNRLGLLKFYDDFAEASKDGEKLKAFRAVKRKVKLPKFCCDFLKECFEKVKTIFVPPRQINTVAELEKLFGVEQPDLFDKDKQADGYERLNDETEPTT